MTSRAHTSAGVLCITACVLLTATRPAAQTSSAAVNVGATVAPQCRITVDQGAAGDRSPLVTVSCGTSGLRVLRVTTSRGESLEPVVASAGRRLRAGGDVVFVIARPVAVVASRLPMVAASLDPDRRPVLVTLDF